MALQLADLIKGPALPIKKPYIDALEDTVEVQTVPLERYMQHKEKVEALVKAIADAPDDQRDDAVRAANKANEDLVEIIVAESLSAQSGMSLEDAKKLNDQVRAKIPPAAFDEISAAVLQTMLGTRMDTSSAGK